MTAARALDLRTPLVPGPATAAVVARVRADIEGPGPDRYLSPEIELVAKAVRGGAILAAATAEIGELI